MNERKFIVRVLIGSVVALGAIVLASMPWEQAECWAATSSVPQPRLQVQNPVYDFGTALEGHPVQHTFEVKNAGQADLTISGVKTSCGCTVAAPSKSLLKPGDVSEIAVTFDTRFQKGHRTRTITISTNDQINPTALLTLQGDIRVEVDAEPSEYDFGRVPHGTERSQQFVISDLDSDKRPFKVGPINKSNAFIAVAQAPRTDRKPGAIVTVTLLPTAPIGMFHDSIEVVNTRKPLQIPVYGVIAGDLALDPAQVSFGIVPHGQGSLRILRLTNDSQRTVNVLGISSSNQSVSAKVEPVKAGKEYKITATLTPGTPDGQLRGQLAIRTDDPEQGTLTIPFYAIVGSFEG